MSGKGIVIGANYYIGLSAIRCLGRRGVSVAAVDYSEEQAYAFRSRHCEARLIAPYYKDNPHGFVQFLVEYAEEQHDKPVLIPTHDDYAEILDQQYDTLKDHCLLPNPSQGFYTDIMHKDTLHDLARECGVDTPETLSPADLDRVEAEIGYPCLLKPTTSPRFVSVFRVKVFEVDNREELQQAISKAQEHEIDVVIQRIIPGFDDQMYTYEVYVDRSGRITHWTTCQKKRQYPVKYGASVFTQQRYVPEIHDIGSSFLQQIGYRGFAEMELKYDARRKKFYLIEINVRLSNLNPLLEHIGLNFPYIMYRDLIGDPLPPKAITRDTGLHFWSAVEDTFAIRDYLHKGQLRSSQVIRSLFARKVPSIWEWQDPIPGVEYGRRLASDVARKLLRIK